MIAKHWKKIGLIILILACLINVMGKFVNKLSLNTELKSTAQYLYNQYQKEK